MFSDRKSGEKKTRTMNTISVNSSKDLSPEGMKTSSSRRKKKVNQFIRTSPSHPIRTALIQSEKGAYYNQIESSKCPSGKQCQHHIVIQMLELEINKLQKSNDQLVQLNKFLHFKLKQSEAIHKSQIIENSLIMTSPMQMNSRNKHESKASISLSKKTADTWLPSTSRIISIPNNDYPQIKEIKPKIEPEKSRRKSILGRKSISNVVENEKETVIQFGSNYYDNINSISRNALASKHKNNLNVSFLALNNEKLNELYKEPSIVELFNLTFSDNLFISTIMSSSKTKLINYSDSISSMRNDLQKSVKLIKRVKLLLSASLELISSVLSADSTKVLIHNTCKILDCERATLFIHDPVTDMLVVKTGEGLKLNEIRVPKDKGIVGAVFTSGDKLKIDDAYQDNRFNKEVDKKTSFKTRNILCFPLIDKDGDMFGAIQAINKRKKCFNADDVELMHFFSIQASLIIKNIDNIDQNTSKIEKYKVIFHYQSDISDLNSLIDFTKRSEEILMELFSATVAQILYVKDSHLITPLKPTFKQTLSKGIAGIVAKTKTVHGCKKVNNCEYFNSLVDLDVSESLVTYPIESNGAVIAILQTVFNTKQSDKNNQPKENDMEILDLFSKCFSLWYDHHKEASMLLN